MAIKTYRALSKGYVDGRVVAEGEVFTTEFKELAREAPTIVAGKTVPGAIKRDKDGDAVTTVAKHPPAWAELLNTKVERAEAGLTADQP